MAMLATLNRTTSRVGWTLRALIILCALAVLALPAIYLSTASSVLADDAKKSAKNEPAAEFLPPLSPSEEKILATLEEPTTMDFTETPLRDAIDYLRDLHGIPIQWDTKALEEAGMGSDTPLTYTQNGVKLRSGLRLLLRPKSLTYVIKDEVLLITTQDAADQELITRTYPVGDLAEQHGADILTEAVTATVAPESWKAAGGLGSIVYVPKAKSFVIAQTHDAHDELLGLLRALRSARDAESKP
jgi:hypothetical protein